MVCTICLEEIIKNDLFTTFCNHIYHKKCIDQWLTKDNSCPLCRNILQEKKELSLLPVPEIIITIEDLPSRSSISNTRRTHPEPETNKKNPFKIIAIILTMLFGLFSAYNIIMIYFVNKFVGYEIINPIYFGLINTFIL